MKNFVSILCTIVMSLSITIIVALQDGELKTKLLKMNYDFKKKVTAKMRSKKLSEEFCRARLPRSSK